MEKTNDLIPHPMVVAPSKTWPPAIAAISITIATILMAFRHDLGAALWTWSHIPTYYYCFLIIPICGYLIWEQRGTLAIQTPSPSATGLAISLFCLALWWAADTMLITELRQLAIVGLLQGVAWSLLGSRLYRSLLFPLALLFLVVPSGTLLLTPLQAATTLLSSKMLALAGVPIYVEGTTLEVPTGNYFVAPGCAGLNFLLAALTLSLLFAHQFFQRRAKKVACVAAAATIAILANSIRVFGIIWLAEASNRHIDIINDHLLYGWLFFSLVILASMALGLRFADAPAEPPPRLAASTSPRESVSLARAFLAVSLTIMTAALATERYAAATAQPVPSGSKAAVELPEALGGWRKVPADDSWNPDFPHADFCQRVAYRNGGRRVELFLAYYRGQRDGHKATGGENLLARLADGAMIADGTRQTTAGSEPLDVAAYHLSAGGRSHLIWAWYWIAGRQTSDPLIARLLGMPGRLVGDNRAAAIAVATEERTDKEAAVTTLAEFLSYEDLLLAGLEAGFPR